MYSSKRTGREELQTVGVDNSSEKHYCKWEQRNGVVAGQVHRVKGVFFNGKNYVLFYADRDNRIEQKT